MNQGLPLADELAVVFTRMSGLLLSQETVSTALSLITSLAKETIPGTVGAGVTLLNGHGQEATVAATGPVVERADGLQYELGEGPCLSAWEQRTTSRIEDFRDETRWPRWIKGAQPLGLRASLSTPIVTGDTVLGAMKVYAENPGAFDDRTEHLISMFAAQAAVLLVNRQSHDEAQQLSNELSLTLRSRDEISMAKGITMARERVDEETAFAMLIGASRQEGRALSAVASALLRSTAQHRR